MAGLKPAVVWIVFADTKQPQWWRQASPNIDIVVKPAPESLRLDLRSMVGCHVWILATDSSPLLRDFVTRLQTVAHEITVTARKALPGTLGHVWTKGGAWRELGVAHG
jgi:hypothetical protein